MRILGQRPVLLVLLVVSAVVYAYDIRTAIVTEAKTSHLALNTWDLTVGIATNQYHGYFVLMPAWVLITAVEATRSREPLRILRYGALRRAGGAFTARVLSAAALLILLTGVAPAVAVSMGLPWGWAASDFAMAHTDRAPLTVHVDPAVIQVTEYVVRVMLLCCMAAALWMLRGVILHRGAYALTCAVLAIMPMTVEGLTGGGVTRATSVSFASGLWDMLAIAATWAVIYGGLVATVRYAPALPLRRAVGRLPAPSTLALTGITLIVAGAVWSRTSGSPEGFHLSVAAALTGGTSYGFTMAEYMVFMVALLGPAVVIVLRLSRSTLPLMPYRAMRYGTLSRTVREMLLATARAVATWWAATVAALAALFVVLLAVSGESVRFPDAAADRRELFWWVWQFGPNVLLQIYLYALILLVMVVIWGSDRGVLLGALLLITVSVPALRTNHVLPVAGGMGGTFFDPDMPSVAYSAVLLTAWALLGTLTVLWLARHRREVYLT